MQDAYATARQIAAKVARVPGVSDVFIPQDIDQPGLQVTVDRIKASQLGLSQKEIVSDIITAMTSDMMIAPSYWVDPKNGNDYMRTVQFPEQNLQSLTDLKGTPIRGAGIKTPTRLESVADIVPVQVPTVVNHYQLKRTIDVYISPSGEDLSGVAR